MSIGKTASKLERKIAARLRASVSHLAIYRVLVIAKGGGAWSTRTEGKMGMAVSSDSDAAVTAIATDLRREYHLDPGY
jgi:hypothetical protein